MLVLFLAEYVNINSMTDALAPDSPGYIIYMKSQMAPPYLIALIVKLQGVCLLWVQYLSENCPCFHETAQYQDGQYTK